MASISAISAFSGTRVDRIDYDHPYVYNLYPILANSATNTVSARVVLGTNYSFGTSGYNSYYVQLGDYQPDQANSNAHAQIKCFPAYYAGVMSLDGTKDGTIDGSDENCSKLFANPATAKYTYTGSTTQSDYGSFGPIICRYARWVHISGNIAFDYQRDYENDSEIGLITKIDLHKCLPTAFDDQVYESSLNQRHIAWLSSYLESELDESVARHIMSNPAIVGYRMNTHFEFHSPIKIHLIKAANSNILQIRYADYIDHWTQRRIGRFLLDIEFLV